MRYNLRLILYVFLTLTVSAALAYSDNTDKTLLKIKSDSLSSLIVSMEYITTEITATQVQLMTPEAVGRESALKEKIDRLVRKLDELHKHFDLLASGVSYVDGGRALQSNFDWSREMKVLLGPLIQELQDLTLRPREIEKLRSNISFYEEHLEMADSALKNLADIIATQKPVGKLNEQLQKTLNEWRNKKNEWESLNNIAVMQLEIKRGDTSISKSIQDIPRIFFKSHGRNMVVSFIVFIMAILLMFRLYRFIKKYSPIHSDKRSFYGRLFDLIYVAVSTLIAFISTLSVLYLFSDWVLLSVMLIFILGVAWASKQALPKMWVQVKLILNLGPVKEGEIVVYKSLPYKVISINLYTTLHNPLVQGGLLKVPISDIVDLRSRPLIVDEPWFPSTAGDWILLDELTCGRVLTQTPESVKVKLIGGAEVFYPTGEYLKLSTLNLSSGFRLWLTFGIDYRYQGEVTHGIPDVFEAGIKDALVRAGFEKCTTDVHVHFKTASQSSLDLEIAADFNEVAGEYYFVLDRTIQAACVNVCNKHGWIIPFMQMTVHMENASGEG